MDKKKERLIAPIIFAAALLVYLCFPTRNYFFDGVDFAHTIEHAPEFYPSLLHPNHLIYNVVGFLFYKLVRGVGMDVRAIAALQILNSLLGALGAVVLYKILRASISSLYLCCTLTLFFAFSSTWWKFSTDADAYIPSVLFVLISFYLVLPTHRARSWLLALAFPLSMCLHQMAVVFYPALALGVFLQSSSPVNQQTSSLTMNARLFNVFKFSAAAFVLTMAAYCYSFYLAMGNLVPAKFLHWTLSYAPDESFGFHAWDNFLFTLRGHSRLIFGGRFNLIKGLMNPLVVVLMCAFGIVVLLLGFQVARNFKRPDAESIKRFLNEPQRKALVLLCLVWIASYLVVLYFVLAHHTYYRLFYLPALITLAGLVLDADEPARLAARKYRLALLTAALCLANFLFLIFPYAHAEKTPPLAFALEMNQVWPRGTVIFYALPNSDESMFRYFNPSTVWRQLKADDAGSIEKELQSAFDEGASVWLETTAIDRLAKTPEGAEWLATHAQEGARRELVNAQYNIRFVQIVPRRDFVDEAF